MKKIPIRQKFTDTNIWQKLKEENNFTSLEKWSAQLYKLKMGTDTGFRLSSIKKQMNVNK